MPETCIRTENQIRSAGNCQGQSRLSWSAIFRCPNSNRDNAHCVTYSASASTKLSGGYPHVAHVAQTVVIVIIIRFVLPHRPTKSVTIEEVASQTRKPSPFPDIPDSVLQEFDLERYVACVTGAADGISFAVAEAMAEAGAAVDMWYNTNLEAEKLNVELGQRFKVVVRAYKVAVFVAGQVQKGVEQVVRDFGRLDVFVANAGM